MSCLSNDAKYPVVSAPQAEKALARVADGPKPPPGKPCVGCQPKKRKHASLASLLERASPQELEVLRSKLAGPKVENTPKGLPLADLIQLSKTKYQTNTVSGTSTLSVPGPNASFAQPTPVSCNTWALTSSPEMLARCSQTFGQNLPTPSLVAPTSFSQPFSSDLKQSSIFTPPPMPQSSTNSALGQTVRFKPSPLLVSFFYRQNPISVRCRLWHRLYKRLRLFVRRSPYWLCYIPNHLSPRESPVLVPRILPPCRKTHRSRTSW